MRIPESMRSPYFRDEKRHLIDPCSARISTYRPQRLIQQPFTMSLTLRGTHLKRESVDLSRARGVSTPSQTHLLICVRDGALQLSQENNDADTHVQCVGSGQYVRNPEIENTARIMKETNRGCEIGKLETAKD
jgi:hypothetical protein